MPDRSTLLKIFGAALAIRWTYALLLFAFMGEGGLKGVDSYSYVTWAQAFADAISNGSVRGWNWFGPHPSVMPLYIGLFALTDLLFGALGPLASVLIQGIVDSATCLLIFRMARAIDPRYALPAAIAAVINPTQIVMSGLVYPDTLFVFFVALSLLGSVRWLQTPSPGSAALIAMGLGGAMLCRILIVPWAAALLVFLIAAAALRRRLSLRAVGQLSGVALVLALCIGAVMGRNVAQSGAWSLTSQGGQHLLWVVPWVKQAHDGTPWIQGNEELKARTIERFGAAPDEPFEMSRQYTEIANEAWRAMGVVPTAKAWIYGAVISVVSPAIILSPPIIQIPRTGFYGTPGASMIEKMMNFLFSSESAVYTWTLLIGIAGVIAIRLVQSAGLVVLIRQAWRHRGDDLAILILFVLWIGFILAVNGPVASPKYRLPIEPVLNILTGIGWCQMLRWRRRRLRSDTVS